MPVAPVGLARPSTSAEQSGPSVQDGPDQGSPRPLRVLGRPRHTRRYVVLALLMSGLGIFGIVFLNALAAEAAFEARTLEKEVTELTLRHDELTAEVAALSAPGRVRQVAQDELGMVPASAAGFLFADQLAGDGRIARSPDPLAVVQAEPVPDDRTVEHALGER